MTNNDSNSVLYIVLGHNCNFNCKYCLEGSHFEDKVELLPEVITFINNFNGHVVTFYGGEPFLYFDVIKKIILSCDRGIHFAAMTNGSLLTFDVVDFCNRYNITLNVSWDGFNTRFTRLSDVVQQNWNNIIRINDLWMDSVISKYNYPREALSAINELDISYYRFHGYHLKFFINPVIKCYESDFFDIDCDRIRMEVQDILSNPSSYLEKWFINYVKNVVPKYMIKSNVIKCGVGFGGFAVSPDGKMYQCKNSSKVVCNLRDVGSYKDYILANDINICEKCLKCSICEICRGGCRINEFQEHFCMTQRAFFEPIVDYIKTNIKFKGV